MVHFEFLGTWRKLDLAVSGPEDQLWSLYIESELPADVRNEDETSTRACRGCHPYNWHKFYMLQALCNDWNPSQRLKTVCFSLEDSSSQRWRDKRHQGSSNHLKWPRETLTHWPGQTMYPQFFFSCLDCAPAHYFTSSSTLKQDRCSRCLLDQSAARWIQGPLRMFSEIQGGFSLVLSNPVLFSHMEWNCNVVFQRLEGSARSNLAFSVLPKDILTCGQVANLVIEFYLLLTSTPAQSCLKLIYEYTK